MRVEPKKVVLSFAYVASKTSLFSKNEAFGSKPIIAYKYE